jgi:hypothetical protein
MRELSLGRCVCGAQGGKGGGEGGGGEGFQDGDRAAAAHACFRSRVGEGCHFECRIRCTAAREIPNTVASLSYLLRVISISTGLTKCRQISVSTQEC